MAPIKKKTVETLKNITMRAALQSLLADLYIAKLLKQDLKNSLILSYLRSKSREELLAITSQRLQILPGILNDEVRDTLITEFFSKTEWDKWPGVRLDVLKVLLNDSVLKLDLGSRTLPHEALSIIGENCPTLKSINIVLDEPDLLSGADNCDKIFTIRTKQKVNYVIEMPSESGPARKRRKLMMVSKKGKKSSTSLSGPSSRSVVNLISFVHLTEAYILHGATNGLLTALGKNSPKLEKLHINYSLNVTDDGIKSLCLKNPENHTQRMGCQLHDLRVRSFHLNPCCSSLKEIDTEGTCVSQFGIAFILKHLPHLRSLGGCNSVSEALEVLVGKKKIPVKNYALIPTIRRHTTKYKLSRMREECVTSNKFLLLSSLCPDLKELTLSHSFKEVDLDLALETLRHQKNEKSLKNGLRSQMSQLRHLKQLSLLNVGSISVRESIKAVGHQLTHLHVLCRGLDFPTVLEFCPNLTSLTLEGSHISAPYEALQSVRSKAAKKLESLKLKSNLPSNYIELLLTNPKKLVKIDISNIGDISDSRIESLVKRGHFEQLNSLSLGKAPNLTIKSASLLIQKCPKLADLQDLGGWNITCEQYSKLQTEIEKGNFDITLTYRVIPRDSDSDASSIATDYTSDLFDAFRNIFPIVII